MSLFNSVQTSVSGISAHANYLNVIGNNIANVSTTGYKASNVEFETLLGNEAVSDYRGGGVHTDVRSGVMNQGTITSTTSTTNLAIDGNGFFVVQAPDGGTAMTRAGAFVPNANGNLVNTAGYLLMGNSIQGGGALAPVVLPSGTSSVSVAANGTLTAIGSGNSSVPVAVLPLANVTSPENLTTVDGDVYQANDDSGAMTVGAVSSGNLGKIDGSSVESSTVDLATELSNMIKAQQGYDQNAKVLSTSADMLSTLINVAP